MPESPDAAKTVTPSATSDSRIGSAALMPRVPQRDSQLPHDTDSVVMLGSVRASW